MYVCVLTRQFVYCFDDIKSFKCNVSYWFSHFRERAAIRTCSSLRSSSAISSSTCISRLTPRSCSSNVKAPKTLSLLLCWCKVGAIDKGDAEETFGGSACSLWVSPSAAVFSRAGASDGDRQSAGVLSWFRSRGGCSDFGRTTQHPTALAMAMGVTTLSTR